MTRRTCLLVCACFCWVTVASATFSLVAVDTTTGEIGVAAASCIADCFIISDIIPGVGAATTQSFYLPGNQELVHAYMLSGYSAQSVIDSVVVHDVNQHSTNRQYEVVTIASGAAAHTGANCTDWAGQRVGPTYAIGGNILLSPAIVDTMEWAFLHTQGTLAERMLAALEAAKFVGADTRCAELGKSAISAFLRVARPGDSGPRLYCDLNVPNTTGASDPIDLLRIQFDSWRDSVQTREGALPGQ